MVDLAGSPLIDRGVPRIGADDHEIVGRLDAPMPGARRQHHHVACLDGEHLSFGAAELHRDAAARNAQHLVRRGVEMQEGVDAVAPAVAPAMPGESPLERHRRIAFTGKVHGGAANYQRQAGIVGRFAVILEPEGLHVGHCGPPSFSLGNPAYARTLV